LLYGDRFMKSPLVSVIVPAYNHEKYVQGTIQSIIDQSYENIELIIIDDGSNDKTWKRILELKSECDNRFKRTVLKTKKNEGTCLTLNKLLTEAKGDYLFLIASDDLAKPQTIEKEVIFLENNPKYALCVGDNEIIDNDGKRCYWDVDRNNLYDKRLAEYITFGNFLRKVRKNVDFLSKNFGSYFSLLKGNYIPNGYMIRKTALDDFKFSPEAPLEDWSLMLHLAKKYKFKYLDEVLFSYRWHDNNTIKQIDKMIKIGKQTIDYEYIVLNKLPDKKLLKLYELSLMNAKFLFKFFNILSIYKTKSETERKIIFEVCDHKLFELKFNRKLKK